MSQSFRGKSPMPVPPIPKVGSQAKNQAKSKTNSSSLKGVPVVPQPVGTHTREKVELLDLESKVSQFAGNPAELSAYVRKLCKVRGANLVTRPLLDLLLPGVVPSTVNKLEDIDPALLMVVLGYLYEAVFKTPPHLKGVTYFENTVSSSLCYISCFKENAPVNKKTGEKPSHIHTVCLGFNSKAEMDAMTEWLYSTEVMPVYGIKAVGYRTGNKFRTQCPFECKVWMDSTIPLSTQEQFITVVGERMEERMKGS